MAFQYKAHKYYKKEGDRYFYSPEEYAAYKNPTKSAGNVVKNEAKKFSNAYKKVAKDYMAVTKNVAAPENVKAAQREAESAARIGDTINSTAKKTASNAANKVISTDKKIANEYLKVTRNTASNENAKMAQREAESAARIGTETTKASKKAKELASSTVSTIKKSTNSGVIHDAVTKWMSVIEKKSGSGKGYSSGKSFIDRIFGD